MARVIKATARVIPRTLADAKAEAEATLSLARREAIAIVGRANAEADAQRAQARAEGLASAHADVARTLAEAARTKDALLGGVHDDVLEIALAAAAKIVEAHVAVGSDQVAALVRGTLDRARRAKQVTLTLHPDDAASLGQQPDALPANVHVEIDPGLSRGDCLVKSELGILDARVATKLEAVRAALAGSR